MSHKTVKRYLERAREAGLGWPLPEGMDEEALEERLFPGSPGQAREVDLPDTAWVHWELKLNFEISSSVIKIRVL